MIANNADPDQTIYFYDQTFSLTGVVSSAFTWFYQASDQSPFLKSFLVIQG